MPDNPNLDFLRQEAKGLLGAMRETDPKAVLSDAQRAVADQYGFRTWPDLKAEVERRRSMPPAADPALARDLAAAFDLGDVKAPLTPISYAFMGRRWRLETDRGVWQAGPVVEWMGNDHVARATELRERARAAGVLAPKPVRAADGEFVKRVHGKKWRVDEWMELGPEVLQPVRSSVARQVGRSLATVHEVAMPTGHVFRPGEPGHLTYRHTDAQWDELIAGTSAAGKPWADDLIHLREGALRALEAVPFRQAAEPLVISIADLNIDGVRMDARDELVLIHWDFAGPHSPEWELAYVLTHWAIYGPASPGAARALVAGYRDRAGSVPTLDLSSFWLTITAHLNWTYNQFCTARTSVGDEQRAYVEGEVRDLIENPFSVTKIEQLLEDLARDPAW
nr:phosphotransferase [Actinopolymorpha cephalotaxi]